MAIRMLIPNVATDLKERIRREAYMTNEIIIRTELLKAKGELADALAGEYSDDENDNEGESSRGGVGNMDETEACLRQRRATSKGRMETGDMTDGLIIV
jgi:hypothetical protein